MFDPHTRAASDAHTRIGEMPAAMYARHLAYNFSALDAASRDHIELPIINARFRREHHAAARITTVDHGHKIRQAFLRVIVIN